MVDYKSWLLIQMTSLKKEYIKCKAQHIQRYVNKIAKKILLSLFFCPLLHDYSSIHTDYEVTCKSFKNLTKCIKKERTARTDFYPLILSQYFKYLNITFKYTHTDPHTNVFLMFLRLNKSILEKQFDNTALRQFIRLACDLNISFRMFFFLYHFCFLCYYFFNIVNMSNGCNMFSQSQNE